MDLGGLLEETMEWWSSHVSFNWIQGTSLGTKLHCSSSTPTVFFRNVAPVYSFQVDKLSFSHCLDIKLQQAVAQKYDGMVDECDKCRRNAKICIYIRNIDASES